MIILIFVTINICVYIIVLAFRNIAGTKRWQAGRRSKKGISTAEIAQTTASQPSPDMDKRMTFYTDLLKWTIGTVGLGLVGIIINKQIQQTDLSIKRVEADGKLLEVVTKQNDIFRAASSDSLELRYLKFVRTFITTDSIKRAVDNRKAELILTLQTQANNNAVHIINDEKSKAQGKISSSQKIQFKKADSSLTSNNKQRSIVDLKNEEKKIAPEITPIDSGAIASLNAVQKIVASAMIIKQDTNYILAGNPVTKWCKEGYYVEFNNLRAGIDDLNSGSQTIKVNFKDIETNDDNPPLIKSNVTIAVGETYTLEHKGRYLITLNYIGGAGRNPFTKAAYITVAVYQKG